MLDTDIMDALSAVIILLVFTAADYTTGHTTPTQVPTMVNYYSQIYIQVRLNGSSNSNEGRVEINFGQGWGTVCDDSWDLNDANVVCRQLGLPAAVSAPHRARFGEGSGPIWLDNVACTGLESSITDCRNNGIGNHNCGHDEDASVICGGDNCGGNIYLKTNESIESPNYPDLYESDLDCYWNITSPPNTRILLTFEDFDLETDYDFLIVSYENENGFDVRTLSGESIPSPLTTATNRLQLSFRTDVSVARKGFRLHLQIVGLEINYSTEETTVQTTETTSTILTTRTTYLSTLDYTTEETSIAPTVQAASTIMTTQTTSAADYFSTLDYNTEETTITPTVQAASTITTMQTTSAADYFSTLDYTTEETSTIPASTITTTQTTSVADYLTSQYNKPTVKYTTEESTVQTTPAPSTSTTEVTSAAVYLTTRPKYTTMRQQVQTTSVPIETAAPMTTAEYLTTYPEESTINCSSRNLISSSSIVYYQKPISTDSHTIVTCIPPPGFSFPEGTSIVTCTDSNKGSCSFNITVDTIPPIITCTDIRSEDETPEWTIPVATDDSLVQPVTCTDKPNKTYEAGSANEVTCTAEDLAGNVQNCSFLILIQTDLSGEIEQLTQNITEENVKVIANQLEDITDSNEDLEPVEFVEITNGLAAITAVDSTNTNVTESVVDTVDNLMDFLNEDGNDDDFEEAATLILDSLEDQIGTVADDGQNYTQEAENFGIQTQNFNSQVLLTDVVFSVAQSNKTNVCLESDCQTEKSNLFIVLPKDIFTDLKATQVNVSFVVYHTDVLFPSQQTDNSSNMSTSGSVLSATIYGETLLEELPEPVEISFTVPSNLNGTTATCVFWDNTVNDWLTRGCSTAQNDGGRITCRCTHLTNFAVLMFPNKMENDIFETFLDIVTYLGCGISIVCLGITIFTILYSKTIRSRQPQKIMVNLCISLTCLYTVFILGVDQAKPETGECKFIAALIHYFLLTSITWTLVEAINMYFLVIKVFSLPGNKFVWIALASAWGIPLLLVVLLAIITKDFYGSKQYCYINSERGTLLAVFVIIPISLIMFCNFIIFGMVIRKLFLQSNPVGKISDNSADEKKKRVINAIAISFLLGLTWVFGFISFEHKAKLPFLILFCLFNSFQGVAIFYLFCLRQKECRDVWRPLYGRLRGYVHSSSSYSLHRKLTPYSSSGTVSFGISDLSELKTSESKKETYSLQMDPI